MGDTQIVREFIEMLDFKLFGQNFISLLILLASVLLSGIFRKVFSYIFIGLEKLTSRSKTNMDDILIGSLSRPIGWIGSFLLILAVVSQIDLDESFKETLSIVFQVLIGFQVIKALYNLTDHATEIIQFIIRHLKISVDEALVPIIARSSKALVIVFGPLVVAQNLGVNVMSLVAGLGLGGLAFALAAKDTAANLFGSFMILVDKPFSVGDWVIIGSNEGTITEIGLRSTRIKTFYDSIISIPNSEVANASIDNMGKRNFRRVKTTLGVTYDTPPEKIEGFLEAIKRIIDVHPHTRKDYYQVVFTGFNASSLDLLLYFFIVAEDWSRELVIKQNIFLDIIRAAKDLDVEFAFPTTTVHIDSYKADKEEKTLPPVDKIKEIAESFEGKANPQGIGVYKPLYEKT